MLKLKKKIAALTAASFFATSFSVVSYAEESTRIILPSDSSIINVSYYKNGNEYEIAQGSTEIYVPRGTAITIVVTSGYRAAVNGTPLTSSTGNRYIYTVSGYEQSGVAVITSQRYNNTGGSMVGNSVGSSWVNRWESSTDYDFTVWANGKDIKANEKKGIEAAFYKTATTEYATDGYTGGKLTVIVTSDEIDTAEELVALYDEKGKLTPEGKEETSKGKQRVSAKIKDGKVTISSGKSPGGACVWIAEVKNKKILNGNVTVNGENYNIRPWHTTVLVKNAASSLLFAETENVEDGVLKPKTKSVSALDLSYDDSWGSQASYTLAIADKKTKLDSTAHYTLPEVKDESIVSATFTNGMLTLTPLKTGKTTVSVTNIESGKAAKVNVTVKGMYSITYPYGVTVTNGADNVYSGTKLIDGTKLTISAASLQGLKTIISVNGKKLGNNGSYTIKGADAEVTIDYEPDSKT